MGSAACIEWGNDTGKQKKAMAHILRCPLRNIYEGVLYRDTVLGIPGSMRWKSGYICLRYGCRQEYWLASERD